jgi:hypothetical protein
MLVAFWDLEYRKIVTTPFFSTALFPQHLSLIPGFPIAPTQLHQSCIVKALPFSHQEHGQPCVPGMCCPGEAAEVDEEVAGGCHSEGARASLVFMHNMHISTHRHREHGFQSK